jgi:hypothetical protein
MPTHCGLRSADPITEKYFLQLGESSPSERPTPVADAQAPSHDERERYLDAVTVRLGARSLLDHGGNIVARRSQPISAEAGRRRAIASDGRAIRTPRSAAAPNARPTSRNAPPTAIPKSEICSAM